jgi:hypothetical protein
MKFLIIIILITLDFINCSNSIISSEDQKCRDLYKYKHEDTPQETCLNLLGTAIITGNRQTTQDLALLNCYLYLEKWKSCGDQSPIKPVIIRTL